ncbi:hypothetical protein ACFLYR_09950 [Chloroflexota bacterium]
MEIKIVTDVFKKEQHRNRVRKNNILRGLPVADPFIVAAGSFYGACVVCWWLLEGRWLLLTEVSL